MGSKGFYSYTVYVTQQNFSRFTLHYILFNFTKAHYSICVKNAL